MKLKPGSILGFILFFGLISLVGCCAPKSTSVTTIIPVYSPAVESRSISFTPSLPVVSSPSASVISTPIRTLTLAPTASPIQSLPEKTSVADTLNALEHLPIDRFFEESYRVILLRDPDQLFIYGLAGQYGIPNDTFSNLSDAYLHETQLLESGILNLLLNYKRETLTPQQQLSFDIYRWVLEDKVSGHAFMYYDYPVNPLTIWGKQNWLINFVVNYQPIQDLQDAEDYLTRVSKIDTWVNQLMEGLYLREQAGIIPPKYVIHGAINQVDGYLHRRGSDSFHIEGTELYTSFREKLDSLGGLDFQEKQYLLERARIVIGSSFIPAYLALEDYLIKLESRAGAVSGYHQFPKGQDYYTYIFSQQTGSDMTPDEAHGLGLDEVKRVQEEILQSAQEAGYEQIITLADLQEMLSSDSGELVGDPLFSEYRHWIAEAEEVSQSFFEHYPGAGLIIEIEPFGSGIGYYLPPQLDGSGPGKFFTNPKIPMPSYLIPTYIFHETIPGHHLQGALARELDLPVFRQLLELNGYLEGWAVYAERLAWEMGLYQDNPQGNLGRLFFELSRAVRLVIDTGIHHKGWSRQDAADYYQQATGSPTEPEAMDRYVILPGQGCGYTIGIREILDLRQRAMDQFGDEFNIKTFHQVVLGSGNLPFQILGDVVDDWISTAAR